MPLSGLHLPVLRGAAQRSAAQLMASQLRAAARGSAAGLGFGGSETRGPRPGFGKGWAAMALTGTSFLSALLHRFPRFTCPGEVGQAVTGALPSLRGTWPSRTRPVGGHLKLVLSSSRCTSRHKESGNYAPFLI